MSPIDLKNIVKEKIDDLEDVELLQDILSIISSEDNFKILELSKKQEEAIDSGLTDVKNDNLIPNEIANKEIDEWLKK